MSITIEIRLMSVVGRPGVGIAEFFKNAIGVKITSLRYFHCLNLQFLIIL